MSNFRVEWMPEVLDYLATIWLDAPDRQAVTKAQAEIDRLLKSNPQGVGMEKHEGLRKLSVPPLEILYTVNADQKSVEVVAVGYRP